MTFNCVVTRETRAAAARKNIYISYHYFKSCGGSAELIFVYIKVKILKNVPGTGSLEWDLGNILIKVLNVFLTLRKNILGSK